MVSHDAGGGASAAAAVHRSPAISTRYKELCRTAVYARHFKREEQVVVSNAEFQNDNLRTYATAAAAPRANECTHLLVTERVSAPSPRPALSLRQLVQF
ncbi:hypothetical protein EVAR_10791_1 [Eumeta japonica]|uniref:Uncharacterized protein n=1 Tax=Eumeta variegata TaxID=151549 RepID=A0A4C1W733_EUMVA|nr:hypothetical protein EVAR_10791_1 [Eumeta japonica]